MKPELTLLFRSFAACCCLLPNVARACTGITLRSKDHAVLLGRSTEWGSFDLQSRLVVVPRGLAFRSELSEGAHGLKWRSTHGAAGVDAVGKDLGFDGMNEKGSV